MRAAGIVVYNPDAIRLKQNIEHILPQIDLLFIYMNSTISINDYIKDDKIKLLNNGVNRGIAEALNEIMSNADKNGCKWCLLLDQDSVVPFDYICTVEKHIFANDVAIIAPRIVDIKDKLDVEKEAHQVLTEIDMCITSGSYNNIEIWKKVGKFRKELFIDYVDWEYCARIRKKGYKILSLNNLLLDHELGKKTYFQFLGKTYYTFNHNAFRKYYITRNTIAVYYLYPYEPKLQHPYLRTIKRMLITIAFENDKANKLKSMMRGVADYRSVLHKLKKLEQCSS